MSDLDGMVLPSDDDDLSVAADACLDPVLDGGPRAVPIESGLTVASLIAGSSLMRASSRLLVTSRSSALRSERILLYLAEFSS